MKRTLLNYVLVAISLLSLTTLGACTRAEGTLENGTNRGAEAVAQEPVATTAVAEIQPINESAVTGTLTFEEMGDSVRVSGTVRGLSEGMHGMHVHEGTSCEDRGDHYNPEGAQHGAPDDSARHVGDLGNIEAGADSTASVEHVDPLLSLSGPQSIVGHVLVVHEGADDYVSQPSGESGTEIGCGVIRSE